MHPKPTMNLDEQSDVVLTLGQALHVNGQSTDDTLAATERLSNSLGLRATIIPSWGELQLEATEGTTRLVSLVAASPTGVHMERVASAMKAIDEVTAGHLPPTAALETIGAVSTEFASAPGCCLTMYDLGARTACAQWHDGSQRGADQPGRLSPSLRWSRRSGHFSRTPPWTGPARRLVTGWRTGEGSAPVA